VITFTVAGTPVTQGSTRAFVRGTRAIVTHDKREPLMNWRASIAQAAQLAANSAKAPPGTPVSVSVLFRLQRPKSAPKRVTEVTTKPDVDKLARAALDALTGVLWADDSQVVSLHAQKEYAGEAQPCGALFVVRTGNPDTWGSQP
jgi:Holliday junction resolvase RusA-like endonuclease